MAKEKKLPKAFKAKWLKALRSGKYPQGKGELMGGISPDYKYCCLGVACEISGVTRIHSMGFIKTYSQPIRGILKIPPVLRGGPSDNAIVDALSIMNDNGTSFKVIADWIENNL